MQIPFTHDQFLEVFAAYNGTFWWAAILLWIGTLGVVVQWFRNPERAGRSVAWLLMVHWAWSGAVYHLGYFRGVNLPALAFGVLFLLQAVLFAWLAYGRKRLDFAAAQGLWRLLGLSFMAYSLVYPALRRNPTPASSVL